MSERKLCGLGYAAITAGWMLFPSCKPNSSEADAQAGKASPVVQKNLPDDIHPIPVKAPEIPRVAVKPNILRPQARPEIRKAMARFQLPTGNDGIFTNANDQYFMFVDRSIKGVATQVWEGGQYGFVRDPKMAPDGSVVYTRFHEGMDVSPIQRDAKGEPMDVVSSMADGTVIYVNDVPRKSNYGNYIIIEHKTDDGPFYSLYAHFREVKVRRGMKVQAGDPIGNMGYTGRGIDRRRAHCHVELNMVLNGWAAIWEQVPAAPVPVSVPKPNAPVKESPIPVPASELPTLNGQNLVGIDVVGWLRANHETPEIKMSEFIKRSETYFKLRTPCRGTELEIVKRYPWLRAPGPMAESWEISISAASVPLKVEPVAEKTEFTTVSWVKPFTGNHSWKSREVLTGSGTTASLSKHGLEYVKLLLAE